MADSLRRNAHVVEALGSALRQGEHAIGTVPALVKRVLTEESWREFVTQRGDHVLHDRFVDFVVTPPLAGLGTTIDLIRRVISADVEALDMLDRTLQAASQPGRRNDLVNNVDEVPRPRGTSKENALRRLRKDAPDLHAEVLAGTLSSHAAMVKAGFTARRFTVEVRTPETMAATLRRQLPADLLAQVIAELNRE
ncbi:hypothetical protein ACFY1S_23560 [Micromonospora sp. NPDC000663]|uniref:hypothetical protein n=1 Tax=Micromonospora sp. NPDC000663 TaxID=3364218 RepID=UPI0036BBB20B